MSEEWAYFIPGYEVAWRNAKDDPVIFGRVESAIHESARALAESQGYRLLAFRGDSILSMSPVPPDGNGVRWLWDAEKVRDSGG